MNVNGKAELIMTIIRYTEQIYKLKCILISVLISYLLFFDHRIPNQCFSVYCLFVHIYGCNLRILICSVIVNSPIHVTAGRIYGYLIFSFA